MRNDRLNPFENLKNAKTITVPSRRVKAVCRLIRMKEREYPTRLDTNSKKLGGEAE